jgi:hypothetical protein
MMTSETNFGLQPLAESIQNLIVSVEGMPEAVHYSTEFIKILRDVGALSVWLAGVLAMDHLSFGQVPTKNRMFVPPYLTIPTNTHK